MYEYKCSLCGKICGAEYKSQARKYCSHKCANQARWKNVPKKVIEYTCEVCGIKFDVKNGDYRVKSGTIKYCSKKCMGEALKTGCNKKCLYCGQEFYTTRNDFCSIECAREYRKANYKHKPYMENGYLVEYVKGYNKKDAVKQHRKIMEEYLGRKLESDEVVHHINGIKTDNRIENLLVMKRGEHSSFHRIQEKNEGKHLFGGYNNN